MLHHHSKMACGHLGSNPHPAFMGQLFRDSRIKTITPLLSASSTPLLFLSPHTGGPSLALPIGQSTRGAVFGTETGPGLSQMSRRTIVQANHTRDSSNRHQVRSYCVGVSSFVAIRDLRSRLLGIGKLLFSFSIPMATMLVLATVI